MNKTGRILSGLIVVLSFIVMISAEYHHYHSDSGHTMNVRFAY
ncbi:MAG: hypothetical protein AB2L26_03230 [Ignavibacteria bacterium]